MADVLFLSGDDDFSCRQTLRSFLGGDRPVPYSHEAVFGLVVPGVCFVSRQVPPKADVDEILSGDTRLCVLGPPPPPWASKDQIKVFNLPPPWKMRDAAIVFVERLLKSRGMLAGRGIPEVIVELSGEDPGVLEAEVSKLVYALPSGTTLGIPDLRFLSGLARVDGSGVCAALGRRDAPSLARELDRWKSTVGDDPMALIGPVLFPSVSKWAQAAHMESMGWSPETSASRASCPLWVWENKILPYARNWGVEGAKRVLLVLASAHRSVLRGDVNPWSFMTSEMILTILSR